MKRMRIYIDASVIGGCHDLEFAEESKALLAQARAGDVTLLISDVLIDELTSAPDAVAEELASLPSTCMERIESTAETAELRDRYLGAGVVGPSAAADAHHVALATVSRADVMVSWNFKHLVHLGKIRAFSAVNLQEGYAPVDIRSPREVV
jgi:hypothetical protein